MPNVIIENDSLSDRIVQYVASSLRRADFEELESEGYNKWNDLYLQIFLQIYSKLIDVQYFTYILSDSFLNEPVVLFKHNKKLPTTFTS
jgi:hypothetical protein